MANQFLKSTIITVVENQMRENKPPQVNVTYAALKEMGYSDYDAKQAIAQALVAEMYEVMSKGREYDEASYVSDLKQIAKGEILFDGDDYDPEDDSDYGFDDDYDVYEDDEFDDEPKEFLYEDLLRDQDEEDLRETARLFGIRTMKKSETEIAKDVAAALLLSENFRDIFTYVHDESMEVIDHLMEEGSLSIPEETMDLIDRETGFRFALYYHSGSENNIIVSDEVRAAYTEIMTPEFQAERKRATWLSDCLLFLKACYGAAPVGIFADLYNTHPQFSVREEEVMDLLMDSGDLYNLNFVRINNEIRARELQKKSIYRQLMDMQKDYDFEIPSFKEIEDIGFHLYPASDPAYRKMENLFKASENTSLRCSSDMLLRLLYSAVSQDMPLQELLDLFIEDGDNYIPAEECEAFAEILKEICRNTRKLGRRGHRQPDAVLDEAVLAEAFSRMRESEELFSTDDCGDFSDPEDLTF